MFVKFTIRSEFASTSWCNMHAEIHTVLYIYNVQTVYVHCVTLRTYALLGAHVMKKTVNDVVHIYYHETSILSIYRSAGLVRGVLHFSLSVHA